MTAGSTGLLRSRHSVVSLSEGRREFSVTCLFCPRGTAGLQKSRDLCVPFSSHPLGRPGAEGARLVSAVPAEARLGR